MAQRLAVLLLVVFAITSSAVAQVEGSAVRVGVSVMADHLIRKVAPIYPLYPPLAKQAHIQGAVLLRVRISKSGDVLTTQLVSGHPMLAPAAIEAVKQWKYTPYLLNGEPVEVETDATVTFTLSDKPAIDGSANDASGGVTAPSDLPGGQSGGSGPVVGIVRSVAPGSVAPGQRVRISSGVAAGLLRSKVSPVYPPDARDQHIQGVVLLQVNIDTQGNPYKVELISGYPLLAPAAIEAVKQWKYRPYLLAGTPVEALTQVQVNFTLAN